MAHKQWHFVEVANEIIDILNLFLKNVDRNKLDNERWSQLPPSEGR